MATLKKYDITGKEIESVELEDALVNTAVNKGLVKNYIVALRKNARQWSANTKGRSDVSCTSKKPHPQKGTGRARQGTMAAPQYKGGGVVFGPKPKFNQHVRINKKERQQAIRAILSEKIQEGKLHLISVDGLEAPKTKTATNFVEAIGVANQKVLFLGQNFSEGAREEAQFKQCELFVKSMRNIPKTSFKPATAISGYDVLNSENILVMDSAFEEIVTMLRRAQ